MEPLIKYILALLTGGAISYMMTTAHWLKFVASIHRAHGEEMALMWKSVVNANSDPDFDDDQIDLFGGEALVGEGEGAVLIGAGEFAHLDQKEFARTVPA